MTPFDSNPFQNHQEAFRCQHEWQGNVALRLLILDIGTHHIDAMDELERLNQGLEEVD